MRSIGLDLGARHIAYCEVVEGKVVERTTVRSLKELMSRLGPNTPQARVAFEACREAWHVHDTLEAWGHEPWMLDTTGVRQIGMGQHRRKNDAIDAEAIAMAVDSGRVPRAHVLSPARRALRAELSVRGALVETRAQYVTTVRGLARAAGVLLPTCSTDQFSARLASTPLDEGTRNLVAPLVTAMSTIEVEIRRVEERIAGLAERDVTIGLCATVPGVGLIVAATFVSVVDEAKRFRNAHAVEAYLGLVPSEATTGGPAKRRVGSITKQGNSRARAMLIQSAWVMFRTRDKEDPIRTWGENIAKTRGKRIAVVAVARKLAGVLWAMLRDGCVYDRACHAEQSARGSQRRVQTDTVRAQALARSAKKLRAAVSGSKTREVSRM